MHCPRRSIYGLISQRKVNKKKTKKVSAKSRTADDGLDIRKLEHDVVLMANLDARAWVSECIESCSSRLIGATSGADCG
jgi:hypothetical protein